MKNVKTREELRTEAISRLKQMEKELHITPEIREKFMEGKVCVSYPIYGGFSSSMMAAELYPHCKQLIKKFEEKHGGLVYHVIECIFNSMGTMLSMLYVDPNDTGDDGHLMEGRYIDTYTFCLTYGIEEGGEIELTCVQGSPCRIG